jgi:hypothetical protein
MALASDANLRVLFCTADEVADALVAARRLRQLAPGLALDASVEGAAVARTEWSGDIVVRRVEAVEAVALEPDGARARPDGGRPGAGLQASGRAPTWTRAPPPPRFAPPPASPQAASTASGRCCAWPPASPRPCGWPSCTAAAARPRCRRACGTPA